MKKIIYIICMVIIAGTFSSCSLFKSKNPINEISKDADMKIKKYGRLTNEIKKEQGVKDGKVYTQNGYAIGTMEVEDGVKKADVQKLVNEYADKLKGKYKNLNINVQAVRKGKSIASATFMR